MPILSFTETLNINFINIKFQGTKHIYHKYMFPYNIQSYKKQVGKEPQNEKWRVRVLENEDVIKED